MSAQAKRLAGGLLTGIGKGILLKAENIESRQAEARKFAAQYSGRSAGDSRLISDAITINTKETFDGDVIDKAGVARYLLQNDRPDLAAQYAPTGNEPVDRDSDEYLDYQVAGKKAYNDKDPFGPNFLYGDVKKDVYDGLDKDAWVKQYADNKWAEKYGGAGAQAGKKSGGLAGPGSAGPVAVAPDPTQQAKPKMAGLALTAPAPAPTAPKPATVSGSGTRDDPYKPSAGQSDADWFEANAKAGQVIEIHGQLYENGPDGLKKAGPNAGTGRKYKSEKELGEAYKNGDISKDEVQKILRQQFGYD